MVLGNLSRCSYTSIEMHMKRCMSITLEKRCLPPSYHTIANTKQHNYATQKITNQRNTSIFRTIFPFSTSTSKMDLSPPSSLTVEMAKGVQSTTLLYICHGLGRRRLDELSKQSESITGEEENGTLVERWQKMMEAFLGTQVHVLAGLGYPASEQGIAMYNQHLAELMQNSPPDVQENLRIQGRDLWRKVLCLAFNLDMEKDMRNEISIVDARNIMHKVSQRMQEPDILEKIAKLAATASLSEGNIDSSTFGANVENTRKHTIVQQVLVHDVYLGPTKESSKSLVEDSGFGKGEKGYVQMQCLMAEHQADPLVAQYMGGAMMRLLQAAGIDLQAMQEGLNKQNK